MDSAPDSDATVPNTEVNRTVFGRYVLERIVGRGGMGVVWLARDDKLDLTVALKFLPDAVRTDPDALRDLRRETKRALRLTHENIVRVHTFEENAEHAAIVMEFVDGQSLSAWKSARPDGCVDVATLAPIVRQLGAALHYAHESAGVIHRDLKPGNLLLAKDGTLKVADFGIARSLVDTQTRLTGKANETSGTLLYMSPQQMMGDKPTPADDIYALGASLYELLTGKPPFFTGDVFMQVQHKTAPAIAIRRSDLGATAGDLIPPAWERTIALCLAKTPDGRPSSIREVLQQMFDSAPVAVTTVKAVFPDPAPRPAASLPAPISPPPAARPTTAPAASRPVASTTHEAKDDRPKPPDSVTKPAPSSVRYVRPATEIPTDEYEATSAGRGRQGGYVALVVGAIVFAWAIYQFGVKPREQQFRDEENRRTEEKRRAFEAAKEQGRNTAPAEASPLKPTP